MEKDTRLVNIYLKIHSKRPITMDDLSYLAEYDPECFAKTCKNVVYNIPEAKPIMEPDNSEGEKEEQKPETSVAFERTELDIISERQKIEQVLENLKNMEIDNFPNSDIDQETVKSLLGNLYMEMLFPHNDEYGFFEMTDNTSIFDKKA